MTPPNILAAFHAILAAVQCAGGWLLANAGRIGVGCCVPWVIVGFVLMWWAWGRVE